MDRIIDRIGMDGLAQNVNNQFNVLGSYAEEVSISDLGREEAGNLAILIQRAYPDRYDTKIRIEVTEPKEVYTLCVRRKNA